MRTPEFDNLLDCIVLSNCILTDSALDDAERIRRLTELRDKVSQEYSQENHAIFDDEMKRQVRTINVTRSYYGRPALIID